MPFGLSTKVLGGSLVGALILSGVLGIALYVTSLRLTNAKEVIRNLTDWQSEMVSAVSLASGNPEVTKLTAKAQVQAIGNSLSTLNSALKTSNDAVEKLAQQRKEALARAAQAGKERAAAIKKAETLAAQLRTSAETSVSPEEMEAEVRRVQDLVYEAGL